MNTFLKKFLLSVYVFLFSGAVLAVVQLKVENPVLLLERFVPRGGWIEIPIIAFCGAFLAFKMQNPANVPKWRLRSWTIFTLFFFCQLMLGIIGFEKFLMTGKLHLPVPAMILSGPLFRGEISFMTILFLSTIVLTGPAWCSQLCYFGAWDNIAAFRNPTMQKIKNRTAIKFSILFLVISITLLLRGFNISVLYATLLAGFFGVAGVVIMLVFSQKKGKMIHCSAYCPIGTLVNYMRFINPFRMYIGKNCTLCMQCTNYCKYDALNDEDLNNKKPDIVCSLCGDCLAGCEHNAIHYKFPGLKPKTARNLWLFLTISVYTVFLALARI